MVPDSWATEVEPNTTITFTWNQRVDPKVAHKHIKILFAVTKQKKVKTTVVCLFCFLIVIRFFNFVVCRIQTPAKLY